MNALSQDVRRSIRGLGRMPAFTAMTLTGMLFGISATDPLTLAAVVTLFALISWSASVIPALRAARVDPSVVLRAD